jgi:hypothetical protein
MVFDETKDFWEEISFAKIIKKRNLEITPPSYAIFDYPHNVKNWVLGDPAVVIAGVSFDYLCGYLDGAILTKHPERLFLYNGISHITRDGHFPNLEFVCLEESELKNLTDIIKLKKPFVDKIKTIQ